eukprot:9826189-Ditylum_brightwellii.AAC.1
MLNKSAFVVDQSGGLYHSFKQEPSVTKYGVTVECPADIQEAKLNLEKAQQGIQEIITKSAEKRREHNKTIAEIHALLGGKTAEQALKAIINAE